MSEGELPDLTMTQLQPMVVMPESTDELIDTLQLRVSHPSDVIIRDDPMMSRNPLNNDSYKSSLFELKNNSTPVMYEMVHIVPKVYPTSSIQQQQQPTYTYVDLTPAVQVLEEDQNTGEKFIDKDVKTEIKPEIKLQTNIKQIKEKQKPVQNKIKSRKGRRDAPEKVYDKPAILGDPEAERKRQNAIMAKLNREKQKNHLADLEAKVKSLTSETEELKKSSEKYRRRSQVFEEQLRKVCSQFGVPIVIVTE